MNIRSLFAVVLTLIALGILSRPMEVDAQGFGDGASLGTPSSSLSRQTPAPRALSTSAQPPSRPSGASRWLGPLAGMAAGGLLASLFLGDAFEGMRLMDILLIGLLVVVGGVLLVRAWRGRGGPLTAAYGLAGSASGHGPAVSRRRAWARGAAEPGIGIPAGLGEQSSRASGEDESPLWLDGPGFLESARMLFIRLQAAWDQADFRDIRLHTTPRLLEALRREHEKIEHGELTEVVRLDADLLGMAREGDAVVASVHFSGLIREEETGVAHALSEVWHLQHDWDSPDGRWLVTGIQQM